MPKNKPVPVCTTGVSVVMTSSLWAALREAGHTTVGKYRSNRSYLLRGCSARVIESDSSGEVYYPQVHEEIVLPALANRVTLPMPLAFMGYSIRRDLSCREHEVRMGCSRFLHSEVLAVAAASDRMVRRSRAQRNEVDVIVHSQDSYERTLRITADGDVRYGGCVYPRECMREVIKRIPGLPLSR